jgi:hypothetical protein
MRLGMNRLNLFLMGLFILLIALFSWRVFHLPETEIEIPPDIEASAGADRYGDLEIVKGELVESGTGERVSSLRFDHALQKGDGTFQFERPTLIVEESGKGALEVKADGARFDADARLLRLSGNVYGVSGERRMWADYAVYSAGDEILTASGVPQATGEAGYVIYDDGRTGIQCRVLQTDANFENIKLKGTTRVITSMDLIKGRKEEDADTGTK